MAVGIDVAGVSTSRTGAVLGLGRTPTEEPGLGKPAGVKLLIDGKQVATGRVEKTVPLGYGAEGFDVGRDNISAVSPDYKSPFAFGGKILSVTIAVQNP
jgi:hypothetical protein